MNQSIDYNQKEELAEFFQNKTVLVSGSTGLIGSRVVSYLQSLNENHSAKINILCLYRSQDKFDQVFSEMKGEIKGIQNEIETEIEYEGVIDYVIHCAGVSGGTKMHLKDPLKVFDIGINGTRNLLDFAVMHDCQGFLYVSTYEVYGTPDGEDLIREDHACNLDTFTLRNIYAEIKRLCEAMCCAYSAKYGMKTNAARLTSTFGIGVSYHDPRFFAEFARCIMDQRDIVLKSTGETVRSYLDADDAASAFLYILKNGESMNAYNLTNSNNAISIKDIAEKMIGLMHADSQLRFDIAKDVAKLGFRKEGCTLMDSSKLEELGWKPVYSLDETIIKMIQSMKENQ